jgi:hypothetical protein
VDLRDDELVPDLQPEVVHRGVVGQGEQVERLDRHVEGVGEGLRQLDVHERSVDLGVHVGVQQGELVELVVDPRSEGAAPAAAVHRERPGSGRFGGDLEGDGPVPGGIATSRRVGGSGEGRGGQDQAQRRGDAGERARRHR